MAILYEIKEATIAGTMDNTFAGIEQALTASNSNRDR
jgi:hypothetical protein